MTDVDMRMLGLIGGTSWHSTAEYYKLINQSVNSHFGDNTNPPLLLFNLNHALIRKYQSENNWEGIAHLILDGAHRLEQGGAEAIIFCANTPHKVYDSVQQQLKIPIIHIADATAKAIQEKGMNKVCFIGTRFTMQEDFIQGRIARYGIEVLAPQEHSIINELHRIILEELTFGQVMPSSKNYVLDVLKSMTDQGAEGVILGCTEFPLMISGEDISGPIFNTTEIHAAAAKKYILNLD